MVYKHAISTIVPGRAITFTHAHSEEDATPKTLAE
jgi:sRNA-binding regulator protein Hfq